MPGKTFTSISNAPRLGSASVFDLYGLVPSETQRDSNAVLSEETLATLESDVIIVHLHNKDKDSLINDPLWQQVEAVKNGAVIYLDSSKGENVIGAGNPTLLRWTLDHFTPKLEEGFKNME